MRRASRRPSSWMRACSRTRVRARGRRALQLGVHRQREVAERLERADTALGEGAPLPCRDPRDEAEMVVGPAPGGAFGGPATHVAMVDGLWIRLRRERDRTAVADCGEEALARAPVVGHVVVDAKRLDRLGRPAQGDVQPLGTDLLDPLELVDVRADLEDRARLDVTSELGVGDLVVVVAPGRGARGIVDPEQEVSVARATSRRRTSPGRRRRRPMPSPRSSPRPQRGAAPRRRRSSRPARSVARSGHWPRGR